MTDIQVLYTGRIVKRADAISQGLKKYFTGKPCKNGHVDQRRVGGGNCIQCVKIHHSDNHEKVKARKAEWVSNNPEYFKERYECRKDEFRASRKARYMGDASKYKKYSREYYAKNKDRIKVSAKIYRERNREQVAAGKRTYKARKMSAKGSHNAYDVLSMLSDQQNKCAEPTCQVDLSDGYHVDHIMPLILGGTNWPSNLQCLCPNCNLRKNAKHPIDWAQENGRLI